MKVIVYTSADGRMCILSPFDGARLASKVTVGDTELTPPAPLRALPVDRFLRRWPVPGALVEWAETEDEFLARIAAKDMPADATAPRVVDAAELPADRTFRDAWRADLTVDLERARTIHKGRLRELRRARFDQADAEFNKLLEAWLAAQPNVPAALKNAMAARQALRDVTADPAIAAASTPEALKAALPAVLARE